MISVTAPTVSANANLFNVGSTGIDVSWPMSNCNAKPSSDAAFGIVGVTGGLDFTSNNCLFSEAHWFNQLSLYMNTGFPGVDYASKADHSPLHCVYSDDACLAYNYGYNAAAYAMLYAASQNIHSTVWWLDVETENSWTNSAADNQASIQGSIDAIKRAVILPTIGIYSTPYQWKVITNNWRNGLPNWVGTGSSLRADAIRACSGNNFTGGGTMLTQYTLELDHDYVCYDAANWHAGSVLLPV
jgi:hypothetical protein